MAAEKRIAVAPELPTLVESGVPVVGGTWVGMVEAVPGSAHDVG